MNYARDVLNMIGRGLQQGIIKSPDIEMMLSDGPKRVPLVQLVHQALADLPPPLTGADAEQVPEPPRARPTPPSAHPALQAANEWAELTAAWDKLPFGTRRYYDELAKCDAAWERIAVALRVPSAEVIRHRFEHWQTAGDSRNLPAIERSGEGYKLMKMQSDWTAWKAAAEQLAASGVNPSSNDQGEK